MLQVYTHVICYKIICNNLKKYTLNISITKYQEKVSWKTVFDSFEFFSNTDILRQPMIFLKINSAANHKCRQFLLANSLIWLINCEAIPECIRKTSGKFNFFFCILNRDFLWRIRINSPKFPKVSNQMVLYIYF